MGIIYKLKPQIKDYILEQKRANPTLSCRSLVALAENKFQIKVSKSSINAIIKNAGLSMPIGRRPKKRRHKPEIIPKLEEEIKLLAAPEVELPVEEKPREVPIEVPLEVPPVQTKYTGAALLKAADYLAGGSFYITEAIAKQLNKPPAELFAKTQALLYSFLSHPTQDTSLYINELQQIRALSLDISRILSTLFQEVRIIKVGLSDGSNFYLDGQLHTVWSTTQIPYDFSTTAYKMKSYIAEHFQKDEPLVFFTAPGYDIPTKEFFDFILSLESKEKFIATLTFCGNKLEELETIIIGSAKQRFFALGFWPWQFGQYRAVRVKEDFRLFHSETLKKDLYIAESEVELLQPDINKRVTLRGCALKSKH